MTPTAWITLAAAAALALLIGFLARAVVDRVLRSRPGVAIIGTRRALRGAVGLVVAATAFEGLAEFAAMPLRVALLVDRLQASGLIVAGALLALALWDLSADGIASRATTLDPQADRLLIPVVRKFVRFAVLLTAALLVLSMFVPNLGTLVAGLGIGGVAIALAAKDSVENILGSITILFDRPFAIGDWVRIDKTEGIVEEINLRSTRIRTFEDTVITLPNANLIRAAVENFGARRTRRQRLTLKLAGDASSAALLAYQADLLAWLEATPGFAAGKNVVALEGANETGLQLLIQCLAAAETFADEMSLRTALLEQSVVLREKHGLFFAGAPRA